MTERGSELLSAIERPLRFLEGGDVRRMRNVKNLSGHILDVSRKALSETLAEEEVHLFRLFQEIFTGFEGAAEEEKKQRISKALALLSGGAPVAAPHRSFLPEEHPLPSLAQLKQGKERLGGKVQFVKGVGPSIAERLLGREIRTIGDLLTFVPIRYEDRRKLSRIKDLQENEKATVVGLVTFAGVAYYKGLRRRIFEVLLEDGSGTLKLKWFRGSMAGMEERFKKGQRWIACGKPSRFRGQMEMHHPDCEPHAGEVDSLSFGRIVPIYGEIARLPTKRLRNIIHTALVGHAGDRACAIPPEICRRHDLLPPWKAIRMLHYPAEVPVEGDRSAPLRSLAFEELFFYALALAQKKRTLSSRPGLLFDRESPRVGKLLAAVPFRLTEAQSRVFEAIRKDMASSRSMNRLLQGDVGSGKTVVAFLSALVAIDHDYQAAFMAPTEILAEQHARTFGKWAEKVGITMACLTRTQTASERKKILEGLRNGSIQLLVGTHAVLEGDIRLKKLGFVVVDEQHRFGVRQRAVLRGKGAEPDVLVMSATPIPRTLALTLYGDLDLSLLDELPAGRPEVTTRVYAERERREVYERLRAELSKGHRAFVVYPLVDPSDRVDAKAATTMADELAKEFSSFPVGLIHGQMPGPDKDRCMTAFGRGEISLLVSTTVIEVGIDVPEATAMLIEHPERFGLSQLHQLRGRIGRGTAPSQCMLIRPPRISSMAQERLKVFSSTRDGFVLAEEDLRMRGPGDVFGVVQSGLPDFRVARFPRDLDLLEGARREAFSILEHDPDFRTTDHAHLKSWLELDWEDRLALVRIG